ncbi:MAG TPA: hypothetical protein VFE62_13110 [Gemmataceae bacterium]|nr:hypothetical protein [Gemmataceae bacterium]
MWDTDSADPKRLAIAVARAPKDTRFLRLKRMDTVEMQIIGVRHADLMQPPRQLPKDQEFTWNGSGNDIFGVRHLGIAENQPLHGMPHLGPTKHGPPAKGLPPHP